MLAALRHRTLAATVAALAMLAAVLFGTAHRPLGLQPDRPAPALLAAYALPDGTVPAICAVDDGAPAGPHVLAMCDACLIAGAPGLPAPAAPSLVAPDGKAILGGSLPASLAEPATRHAPASRGPPLSA
ncbi:hypothetical protein [Prosthecomicrobium sp. N25]|uniref:hypothetical protein n=1 Tax=Prosthecomicrobium sp. N25 TaxID=3129254 RepID=UPI00307688D3